MEGSPKRNPRSPQTYIALLRGVNLAGNNTLSKQALVSLFEDVGCRNVRTYIQSGNVLFEAGTALARQVARKVEHLIKKRFGLSVPVLLRTAGELRQTLERNPFLKKGVDQKRVCVMFLENLPAEERLAKLDPHRSPPDEYVVDGREIYLWCPGGFGRTKYTNSYFDRVLDTTSTGRGWSTVMKLVELSGGN